MKRRPESPTARRTAGVLSLLVHGGLLALIFVEFSQFISPPVTEKKVGMVIQLQRSPAAMPVPVQQPPPPKPKPPKPMAAKSLPVTPKLAELAAVRNPSPRPPEPPQPPTPPVTAPPAPPVPASADVVERFPREYLEEVETEISFHQLYPTAARSGHQQGKAVVHIHIRRDGTVLDVTVVQSSGYPLLDDEARGVILRIAKFEPLPAEYSRGQPDFAIDQPITFHLN